MLFFNCSFAQQVTFRVPNHSLHISLTEFINDLEKKEEVKFFYLPQWTDDIIVRKSFVGQPIEIALKSLLINRGIEIEYAFDYGIVLLKDPSFDKIRRNVLNKVENEISTHSFGNISEANWRTSAIFTGKLLSENFEEPIIGATIYANEVQKGSISDEAGSFELDLPIGEHLISVKSQNFSDKYFFIQLYESGNMDVILEESPLTLDEVIVQDNANAESFNNTVSGSMRITAKEIEKMPSMMGEVDIIKSIQILPGVNTVGEGSAGFNVRGGSADQNLILLDNGIIINPNHLFGFFSAFHPDAIKDATFYRGAIPAQYGGRVSSVLDIRQKDGDMSNFKGSGGLGLITSRLMFEGPLKQEKVSFLFAGRASYSDWILKRIKDDNVRQSSTSFYDFTAKVSAFLDEKDKVSVSIYGSSDKFKFADDTTYRWQNSSVAINHERNIKEGFSLFNSISVGRYAYEVRDEDSQESFSWKYGINNIQLKSYINWRKGKHLITAGVDFTGFKFERGSLVPLSNISTINEIKLDNDHSLTSGIFVSDEVLIGKFVIIPSLRFSAFNLFGPHSSNIYNPDFPRDDSEITDLVSYESGEVAETYYGLEPRLAAKYSLNANNFIKFSLNRSYQYIHLISNTAAITPIDSWVPSSKYLKPQIGYQYSLGFFKKLDRSKLTTSLEVFYKKINNVPEYINGAELALKQNVETELIESQADIRGMEMSLTKEGRLSGQLNYTYTSSRRRTKTAFEALQINGNNFFPSNYDQPHNVKLNANYDIAKRYVLSFNFNLSSGRPISAPTERFVYEGITIGNYPTRNQFRIPIYHRLDVSLLLRTNHKKNKKWEGSWALTIYNIYGRKNAYSVYFREGEERQFQLPKAYKLSVLGSILPSITYNFLIK